MFLHNREELQNLRKEAEERLHAAKLRVLVCAGTGCIASGSKEIYDKMKELSEGNGQVSVEFEGEVPHPEIRKSGCHGFCEMGPLDEDRASRNPLYQGQSRRLRRNL